MTKQYFDFLNRKIIQTPKTGFKADNIQEVLKPHQRDIVSWCLEGGCRGIGASFGLGKTLMQLEIARQVILHTGKPFLIGLPLGVVQEFYEDAGLINVSVAYVTSMDDVQAHSIDNEGKPYIYLSNYERIRAGEFEPEFFAGVSFDEGDIIRNLDTETTNYILNSFQSVPYRFIATATPAPNDYTELLNYAQFLGVADRSQMLTRFFQRNSTTAGDLTLYEHKVWEFWMWVRSWMIIIQKPSDLNPDYSDDGYDLPELIVNYHKVSVTDRGIIYDRDGNIKMFSDPSKSLPAAAKEKRDSMSARLKKVVSIVNQNPDDHFIIWHHLEDERKEIERLLPAVKSVFGSQKWEDREKTLIDFKNGLIPYLSTKPEIAGSGCNFQSHCHRAIYAGIDYRFKDFIQSIHRILRYGQTKQVQIEIIYSDAEDEILKTLLRKWRDHNEMVSKMSEIIRDHGLSESAMIDAIKRSMGVDRKVAEGKAWKAIHNDSVLETMSMQDNSIDMIMTSIPFSDQYEYCESYHDMGHNDGNEEFFEQLGFLTEQIYRILKPGRVAAIHVKDRIRFSYQNGQGFTSLIDFSGQTVAHFEKYEFHLLGKHFITTDVVMENNQTYRLGWSEQCKDGTKMGSGSPEYLLIFRKAPTEKSNAYADTPVVKTKENYTRARWQLDAHAYWKSSGNRLLNPEELKKMDLSQVGKNWEAFDKNNVYDYNAHVHLCEELDSMGKLPSRFMAAPPRTENEWVWDDVVRMRTLNAAQVLKKREKHVCPLQFDIVDRAIVRYTNENEAILDPFGGIMTVPFRCIHLNRVGIGIELNEMYWRDGIKYCQEAEYMKSVPTLFDTVSEKNL